MNEDELKRKLNAIHGEVRDMNNKLNTLLYLEYGVAEVAAELNLSRGSIYKIDPLKLPFRKRGKFRIYKKEDVLKYKFDLYK